MKAINLQHIHKSFSQRKVLEDISLEIDKGEIFGLLGPSGAGKTTLIKIMLGQLEANQGVSYILDKDSTQLSREDYTRFGLVLDQSGLYERLTCFDNLQLYASFYHLSNHDIDRALEQVGLLNDKKKIVSNLSKGMKQRLVIARAIMHHPDILFLDEPTSGLDPATALKIHELLLGLKAKGVTVFLTTHNMEEAAFLCNRVALLNEGKIIECDEPVAICNRYNHLNKITITTLNNKEYIFENNKSSAKDIYELMASDNVQSIHSSEPTLGNVFIALTGKELV